MMSAAAQARMKVAQSMRVADRVASSRQSPPGFRMSATHASLEQSL
jgi:hypothetical protein